MSPDVVTVADGDDIVVTLSAGRLRAEVLSYGAHLVGLRAPDRTGGADDVVVALRQPDGSVDVDAYRDRRRNPYLGAMVGRYANRLAGARLHLDGTIHQLAPNEGRNQLHGGPDGFDRRAWTVSTWADDDGAAAQLELVSPDGDQGFPGTVSVTVTYRLDLNGTLHIDTEATTDATTVVNVTNHAYWNLHGTSGPTAAARATVRDHVLQVAADRVVAVDGQLLPTGALEPVAGTAFDLRAPTRLGAVVDHPTLVATGGLDHCLVSDPIDGPGARPRAVLLDPASGRRLQLWTDQPGVQVYTANHGAGPLPRHGAVCLETQQLPDAPNQPAFPSPVLRPGERYRHHQRVRLDTVD